MRESALYNELSKMKTRHLQLYLVSCQDYLSDNPASKGISKLSLAKNRRVVFVITD